MFLVEEAESLRNTGSVVASPVTMVTAYTGRFCPVYVAFLSLFVHFNLFLAFLISVVVVRGLALTKWSRAPILSAGWNRRRTLFFFTVCL